MENQSLPTKISNSHLVKGHCVPCEGGIEPMAEQEIAKYLTLLKTPWKVDESKKIEQQFKFKSFSESMKFVNKIAGIAEEQGHHPDIKISYDKVNIELTTHAIGGLSPNDFIIAAKIETIK